MKPLPPTAPEKPKATRARAMVESWRNVPVTHPLAPQVRRSQPPRTPVVTPTSRPNPICSSPNRTQVPALPLSISTAARARQTVTTGAAIPSLSPLSTLRAWRMRTGIDRSVTTAWPRAASVGARIEARRAASHTDRSVSRRSPAPRPAAMVRGMPMPSSRPGSCASLRASRRSMRVASVKRTRARVTSASTSRMAASTSTPSRSRPSPPMRIPKATKAMGPDTRLRAARADTSPNPTTSRATMARSRSRDSTAR